MSEDRDTALRFRDIQDSLDSLHQRMDRFYEWASALQVEMRNAHQRVWALEHQSLELHSPVPTPVKEAEGHDETSLLERLDRLTRR
jgi:hypothetical protein